MYQMAPNVRWTHPTTSHQSEVVRLGRPGRTFGTNPLATSSAGKATAGGEESSTVGK